MPTRPTPGGFCFAEASERPFDQADVIWSPSLDPAVLTVDAEGAAAAEHMAIDLCSLADHVLVIQGGGCEHAALETKGGRLRLDIVGATILNGPVLLRPRLVGAEAAVRLQTLVALMRLSGVRGIDRWRLRPDSRMPRLVEALRALDARRDGATLREIATLLLGPCRSSEWPGPNAGLKSWVRRRLALGGRMIRAGPAGILNRAV